MRLRIARAGTDSIEASAVPSAVRGARAAAVGLPARILAVFSRGALAEAVLTSAAVAAPHVTAGAHAELGAPFRLRIVARERPLARHAARIHWGAARDRRSFAAARGEPYQEAETMHAGHLATTVPYLRDIISRGCAPRGDA